MNLKKSICGKYFLNKLLYINISTVYYASSLLFVSLSEIDKPDDDVTYSMSPPITDLKFVALCALMSPAFFNGMKQHCYF